MLTKLLAFVLLAVAVASATDASSFQAKALELYPALSQPDSRLNQLFLERVKERRAAGDPLMQRPDWPLVIATQVARELGIAPVVQGSPGSGPIPKPPASVTAAVARPASGKAVGIVTQFEPNGKKGDAFVMVKSEGAKEATRYLLAAPGSEVDPKLQAALKSVFPSNLVSLEWKGQEAPVVTSIRTLLPSVRTGVLSGTVVDRLSEGRNVYIDVKPDREPTERYLPNWVDGGWNKEVCAAVAAANIGDKVKIHWYYDERRRVVELSVTAKAFGRSGSNP